MRRNRKKTTFIAALCLLAALSTACRKQPEEHGPDSGEMQSGEAQSEDAMRELSFEEQYDLGMRLLSEGSYEEAIIAFTAALEIDPRSVDIYTALADTYEAMGDTEGLRRILAQGIEATGDEGLRERLANLPVQVPKLPEIWEGDSTYYADDYYVIADEELESIFAEAIEAGLAGNRDVLMDAAWNEHLAEQIGPYLKEKGIGIFGSAFNLAHEGEDLIVYDFWTQLSDGNVLRYYYSNEIDQHLQCDIVYRAQDGKGFYSYLLTSSEKSRIRYSLMQGELSGWLFESAFTRIDYGTGIDSEGLPYEENSQVTGTASNDLVDGERVTILYGVHPTGEEYRWTKYEIFQAGEAQEDAWTDESGDKHEYKAVEETGEVWYGNSSYGHPIPPWSNIYN